jgi:hypothetical protein
MVAVNAYVNSKHLPAVVGMRAFTAATLIDQPRGS